MIAPFDSVAHHYDTAFTDTPLARALRGIVWERLAALFPPGARVLELACGTGEDARFLAERGVRVLATDQSEVMLAVARQKAAGLPVDFARLYFSESGFSNGDLGLRAFRGWDTGAGFDGVFSNFGGLNALSDFRPLASDLSSLVRPGGHLLFVIMGRWCAWEILWSLAHLDPRTAFRRWRGGPARANVGGASMTVYYPATAALRRAFAPHFRLERARPLGLFLPPSYLEPLTRRRYFPFRLLADLDRRLPFPPWGDHTLYEWVRA